LLHSSIQESACYNAIRLANVFLYFRLDQRLGSMLEPVEYKATT